MKAGQYHMQNEFCKQVDMRFWVISDLQQSNPVNATKCLTTAVEDFRSLGLDCQRIIYLGDPVEGNNLEHINEMVQMQRDLLGSLDIPLRFVMGNHDLDYYFSCDDISEGTMFPFWDMVSKMPGWQTTASFEDFYFTEDLGDVLLVFFSDHADANGRWSNLHGEIRDEDNLYPYGEPDFTKLRDFIASRDKKVITCSHYAFAGGNRESKFLNNFFPLPQNILLHLYGHAHIGDAVWAGKDCYRKISWVDGHDVPQVDVASLENLRGNAVRSVFVEIGNGSIAVKFRNHSQQKWDGVFVQNY